MITHAIPLMIFPMRAIRGLGAGDWFMLLFCTNKKKGFQAFSEARKPYIEDDKP